MIKNNLKEQVKKLGLLAEDHLLKSSLQETGSYSNDLGYVGGKGFCDYEYVNESIRLIGTKQQISQFWLDNDFEIKDTWKSEVNEKYLKGYLDMNKQLLIIKLI
tara:strand:+ start:769 stop:1080 length:312 start_codon:yes stop_codon:yes gene_type:complete